MPLAQRAARALTIAQAADTAYTDWDTPNPVTRRRRGRLARTLAAILGVDPASVIATADPDRSYGGYPGDLLTVIEDDTAYRFVPAEGFSEDGFCLLGPCPTCERRTCRRGQSARRPGSLPRQRPARGPGQAPVRPPPPTGLPSWQRRLIAH